MLAIGGVARGIIAIGGMSMGLALSIGGMAVGVIGSLVSLGRSQV